MTNSTSSFPTIQKVCPEEEQVVLPELSNLLQDAVASGGSVGFLPPLSAEEAREYWSSVFQEIVRNTCILLVAREAGQIVGSVQLALATLPNASHRAEVRKLFVLQTQRHRGTGRALLQTVEQTAHEYGRTLLVLNTRQDNTVEHLYRQMGYHEVGVIPAYARSASGKLDNTIVFYKTL